MPVYLYQKHAWKESYLISSSSKAHPVVVGVPCPCFYMSIGFQTICSLAFPSLDFCVHGWDPQYHSKPLQVHAASKTILEQLSAPLEVVPLYTAKVAAAWLLPPSTYTRMNRTSCSAVLSASSSFVRPDINFITRPK